MNEILKITGLTGGYLPRVPILNGIDLALVEGEAVGIIGLNGSGKSTLGKAVMNMLPWRRGEIYFAGEDFIRYSVHELAQRGIAIMQQGGTVFPPLTVQENLRLAFGDHPDEMYVKQLERLVPIIAAEKLVLNKKADRLSGGQRHQLALAMTLARRPRLMVLDEPSAGLSPRSVEEMYGLLTQLRTTLHVTILLIEQNINKAIHFCDRCILLEQGRITHELTTKNINEIECLMFKK